MKPFKKAILGRLIKVDQHVPAEDHIEFSRFLHRPGFIKQVDLPKGQLTLKFGFDSVTASPLPLTSKKPLAERLSRQCSNPFLGVNACLSSTKHFRVDIRGELGKVKTRIGSLSLFKNNRQRVRLFTRRTTSMPDFQSVVTGHGFSSINCFRNNVRGHKLKVVVLAIKVGLVSRHRIDKKLDFIGVGNHIIVVAAVRTDPADSHAALQSGL